MKLKKMSCFDQIIVIQDRYSGVYSGGRYTAWLNHVPSEVCGGDGECLDFWETYRNSIEYANAQKYFPIMFCGMGQTPMDAISDLAKYVDF